MDSSVAIGDRDSLKPFFVIRSFAFSLLNFHWPPSTLSTCTMKVSFAYHCHYNTISN